MILHKLGIMTGKNVVELEATVTLIKRPVFPAGLIHDASYRL